jgi:hypothetical protein
MSGSVSKISRLSQHTKNSPSEGNLIHNPPPPWDDNTSWVSACPSKVTMFTSESLDIEAESVSSIKTSNTSVFTALPKKISRCEMRDV